MNVFDTIQEVVANYADGKLIGHDELLADNGIDSVAIIEIILELEEKFNVEFAPDQLNYQTLKCIRTIGEYFEKELKNM